MIEKLDAWHRTRPGLLFFGLFELALAYLFVSLSIDRGNLLFYVLTLIFLAGGIQNIVKLLRYKRPEEATDV